MSEVRVSGFLHSKFPSFRAYVAVVKAQGDDKTTETSTIYHKREGIYHISDTPPRSCAAVGVGE